MTHRNSQLRMSKIIVNILLDSDVIIHFVKGDRVSTLIELFPRRMMMLDRVDEELRKNKTVNVILENMVRLKSLSIISFPSKDLNVFKEYAQLIKTKGKGESACLAYCRYHPHIIASSNLTDIRNYCDQHKLAYITTMDILCIALYRKVLTERECDDFIQKVRASNSKLPDMGITKYRDTLFDQLKYSY